MNTALAMIPTAFIRPNAAVATPATTWTWRRSMKNHSAASAWVTTMPISMAIPRRAILSLSVRLDRVCPGSASA